MTQTPTPLTDAAIACEEAPVWPSTKAVRNLARTLERRNAELVAALDQIERLSRTADRSQVDVASMLGDIARALLARARS